VLDENDRTIAEFENYVPIDKANEVLAEWKAVGVEIVYMSSHKIVSTGHSKVMMRIKKRSVLNALSPDYAELRELSSIINCDGYFVFTFDTDKEGILTEGRMFAPVTGNANGPLGGYLIENKIMEPAKDVFRFSGY
jgi:PhzF family phenazine biosynthesis protein